MQYAFSDGSPINELLIFVVVAALCVAASAVSQNSRFGALAGAQTAAFALFLRRRLFTVSDSEIEQRRLDILRIFIGFLALLRNAPNFSLAIETGQPIVILATGAATFFSLLVLIGLATPVSALVFAVILNPILDNFAHTSTLSSLIMSMSLLPIALAPAGRRFSVDAILLARGGRVGRAWQGLYGLMGPFTLNRAAISKFLLLLAYGGISFSSGLLHLQFEVWLLGLTNTWMFINPIANPHNHGWMEAIYAFSPHLYVTVTQISGFGTLIFQLAMIPLLLISKWTRWLIIVLEFGFVIGSITMLALKWLGWNQLALCMLLFWNRWKLNDSDPDQVSILYDPSSRFARTFASFVSSVDVFSAARFEAASQGHLARSGAETVAAGRAISSKVLLLLPVWPLLWVADRTGVAGAALDRLGVAGVAVRESRQVGTAPAPDQRDQPLRATPLFAGSVLAFAVMFGAFLARLPLEKSIPGATKAAEMSKQIFGQAPLAFGLFQINAFNFPPIQGPLYAGKVSWRPSPDQAETDLMVIPPVTGRVAIPDILFYQTIVNFNLFRSNGLCFDKDFARHLLSRPGLGAVLARDEYKDGVFKFYLRSFNAPTLEDFVRYRYVPLQWTEICSASFAARDFESIEFQYSEEALASFAKQSTLGFPVAPAGLPLVVNFPCMSEARRIAFYFDRSNLAPRRVGDPGAAIEFLRSAATDPPPACLAKAIGANRYLDTDWSPNNPPSPDASCEPDLSAASELLGTFARRDAVAQQASAGLTEARRLKGAGDETGCLLKSAEVRRLLFGQLSISQPMITR